ncbi:S1 family peptidase [Vibrio sp. MA40-2]|uniref:S1 family peptidase n=1 Tax=Vibrio sp. MA40-2 TaxID=3391828 RepID=UPI0039A5BEA0
MRTLSIVTTALLVWCNVNQVALASSNVSSLIYNGETTSTGSNGEWPSIATLYYDAVDYSGIYSLYCGASIVDSQHVLTAAHCLYDGEGNLNEDYLIYTSVVPQMEDESEFLDGTVDVIRASEFYVHSGYVDSSSDDSTSWPNDIAIIKLAEEMNINSSDYATRASQTNAIDYRVDGTEFIAVGHGLTETGDEETLLQTTLEYQSEDYCDFDNLNDSQLCMSGRYDSTTNVRNSTCSGDSGGPLYWDANSTTSDSDSNSNYVQVGITSYGWTGCYNASSDDTSVFTEVADYESWITSVLQGNETPDYTVTSEDRDQYYDNSVSNNNSDNISTTDSSSSSGGSLSFYSIILLAVLIFFRKKVVHNAQLLQ